MVYSMCIFFFKHKTAYEMRISDWSSDVCSSDLVRPGPATPCAIAGPCLWLECEKHPAYNCSLSQRVLEGVCRIDVVDRGAESAAKIECCAGQPIDRKRGV